MEPVNISKLAKGDFAKKADLQAKIDAETKQLSNLQQSIFTKKTAGKTNTGGLDTKQQIKNLESEIKVNNAELDKMKKAEDTDAKTSGPKFDVGG